MFPTQEQHLIQQDAAGDVSTWDDRRDAVFFFLYEHGGSVPRIMAMFEDFDGEISVLNLSA